MFPGLFSQLVNRYPSVPSSVGTNWLQSGLLAARPYWVPAK